MRYFIRPIGLKTFAIIPFLSLMLLYTAHAQNVSVQGGTNVTVLPNTHLALPSSLINSGTLNTYGSIVMNDGDFVNNGTALFEDASHLVFNGTAAAQNLNSLVPLTIANMAINNSAGVTLNQTITLNHILTLSSGILHTDSAMPIHFGPVATDPAESHNSLIMGRAKMDSRPTGTAQLVFLGCDVSFGIDLVGLSIERTTGPQGIISIPGGGFSTAVNWRLTTPVDSVTPNRNVKFSWLSEFDNGIDLSTVFIYGTGKPLYNNFAKLHDTASNVSANDPRQFKRVNLSRFNRIFTFSNDNFTKVAPVVNNNISIAVYPNPFIAELNISIVKTDTDPVHISIADMSGRIVWSAQQDASKVCIIPLKGLGNLAPGSYFLEVHNDHFSKNIKLVKTN